MRIATKVWLCIAVVAFGYTATVAVDALLGQRNQAVMRRAVEVSHPAALACQEAATRFEQAARDFEAAVVFGESTVVEQGLRRGEEASAALRKVAALPGLDPGTSAHLAELVAALARHHARAKDIYAPMSAGRDTPELRTGAAGLAVERERLRRDLASSAEGFSSALRQEQFSSMEKAAMQRRSVLLACVAIVASTLAVVALVMRGWTRRLTALLAASDRLATGDFRAELPTASGDEVGRLVRSFAAMRDAVGSRDLELRRIGDGLECTVAERTHELADKNARLSQEVAERQRAERDLRLLESAVGQISEGVVLAAVEDNRVPRPRWVNQGFVRINGLADAKTEGIDLLELAADGAARDALGGLLAEASAGREAERQFVCRRRNGGEFPSEWHVAPVRDSDGAVRHLVAIERDISERRRAEAALAEANRRSLDASQQAGRAEVATNVLHNVGNVLNSVNVSVALLEDALATSRARNLARAAALLREHADDLQRFLSEDERGRVLPGYLAEAATELADEVEGQRAETRRLAGFIGHIKDVIAMQQGYARVAGVLSLGDPAALCEDALRVHAPALERIGAVVERRCMPCPSLMLDRSRILQVLINLVGNARQALSAHPGERRLTVSAEWADGQLRLAVEDSGVGITAQIMPRLFTHGFTTRSDGHGFGLHASAIAAREMGGTLRAASDGPGRGAAFILTLPAQRSPA